MEEAYGGNMEMIVGERIALVEGGGSWENEGSWWRSTRLHLRRLFLEAQRFTNHNRM